ncbi:hypothetical protein NM688_g3090 [Phlebia brevispora]|uniref:Uncharacterized protein n=1 Tax=Phlebia brevispora TaxID=194682 RepID=A0ACC1T7E6_9APHY|nr:hypothetical protein NM688_g3090 [Phlebia brevispora]
MSTSQRKDKGKEVEEEPQPAEHSESELSDELDHTDPTLPQASIPSTSSKKKKKKRSKAIKVLNSLKGHKDGVPQEVVDVVLEKVKETGEAPGADEETVRLALEHLKIKDLVQGKAGLGGKNKKETGGHKFWATQPVPQLGEEPPIEDGYIEPSKPASEVRQDPYPLPKEFEWSIVDVSDDAQLRELYELLSANYVEDDDASFRFQYSAEFLRWALTPPGYHKEWHVAVRVAASKKLVAFVSGVPIRVRVRENLLEASEVNFLCVHKKLRSKRLAPVLIKEITRQCHLKGIFQALYYHRCLNIPKLVNVHFVTVPSNMTMARMIRLHRVPERPHLLSQGLREMEERDVPVVTELYAKYMKRFGMAITMTEDEARHHFLSGRGTGPSEKDSWKIPRDGQVIWTYVVENPQTHKVTDFFSFYSLPSTIMNSTKHNILNAAYLYYYATDVAFKPDADKDGSLKDRLMQLISDALIIADQSKFDVFNALTLMDNVEFISDLKFGGGDGLLNYYLYNWRTAPLAGIKGVGDVPAGRGIGVVML